MLNNAESRLYHWLGQRAAGFGAVVDLGTFAGGSAARLLSGLALSGRAYHLHAYDFYTASGHARERFVPGAVADTVTGKADIYGMAQAHLAPWAPHVSLHRGDIAEAVWDGGPIAVLVIDAAKRAVTADHIARTFMPHLVAGQSVVVQQDLLQDGLPWLPAQMVALSDYFVPLTKIAPDNVVFLCTQVPGAAALAAADTLEASDDDLIERIERCADWLAEFAGYGRFRAQIGRLRAHPGARIEWQLKL